jgi:hypothetical protein
VTDTRDMESEASARGDLSLPCVAALVGSDAHRGVVWDVSTSVDIIGNNDSWRLIDLETFRFTRCHIAPNYFRAASRWKFAQVDVVLNMITDPDQNPKTIEVAERITSSFNHIVNPPRLMPATTRSEIAKRLQGIARLVVPKVVLLRNATPARARARLDELGFRFPAILRKTGTHSGKTVGLVNRLEELETVFGDRRGEYFLTEFVDFASPDGLYRKTRLLFIGDQVLFRNTLISDHWSIHARDRFGIMAEREDLRREEQDLLEGGFNGRRRPALDDCLREIKRRIKLDYFGLDCAFTGDGGLLLFELNATMNFFPLSNDPRYAYLKACVAPAMAAMTRLLKSRMIPVTAAAGSKPSSSRP